MADTYRFMGDHPFLTFILALIVANVVTLNDEPRP